MGIETRRAAPALAPGAVAASELLPGAIAGRGLRLPAGGLVPLGTPLGADQIAALRKLDPTATVPVLTAPPARPEDPSSEAAATRAATLMAVFRAQLPPWPLSRRAVDPRIGEAAAGAVEMAIATAAWFVPASELILSRGLAPSFLGHATDTCALAAVTAARFGWEESVLLDVVLAALLADIGMLTVPDEVVGKPGRLTAAERRAVEAHTTTTAAILEPFREVAPLVPLVAAQHHEQVDGGGYPEGRSGEGVRPETQVVAIAHRYLAMVTARGYRAAVEPHWALHGLDELSGTVVSDPVVRALTAAVAPYPSGAYLTLVDGRAGRVVRTRGRALELEVMFDALGEPHQPAVERIEPNRIRSFCDAVGA